MGTSVRQAADRQTFASPHAVALGITAAGGEWGSGVLYDYATAGNLNLTLRGYRAVAEGQGCG
jgi:hypothetical protein